MHCFDIVVIVLIILPETCETVKHILVGPTFRSRGIQSKWNCWPCSRPRRLEACDSPGVGSCLLYVHIRTFLTLIVHLRLAVAARLSLPPLARLPKLSHLSPRVKSTNWGRPSWTAFLLLSLAHMLRCNLAPREKPWQVNVVAPSLGGWYFFF